MNTPAVGAVTVMAPVDAATEARICGAIAAQRASLGEMATVVEILKLPDEREFARRPALSRDEGVQRAAHDVAAPSGAS